MCGVIGVLRTLSQDNQTQIDSMASYEVYRGLLTIQHRGQDAAGILSYDSIQNKFFSHKNLGLVAKVFNKENLSTLHGQMSIGHTRYATNGSDGVEDLQPLVTGFPLGIGMVHNGNIVNYHALSRKLKNEHNHQLLSSNDLEVFLHLWCQKLLSQDDLTTTKGDFNFEKAKEIAGNIFTNVIGGYAVLGVISGKGMIAMRDPKGIRPLVLGKKYSEETKSDHYCFSSESLALNFLGYEVVRDVAPGELIYIGLDGSFESYIFEEAKKSKPAHCMFEWVYFSSAEASLDDRSVYGVRLNLGQKLGDRVRKHIEKGKIVPDIVCPVPDTSRTSAIALAEELGLPYREALIKNRYIQRSFILNTQEEREKAVELKLSPVRSEIEGKNILLVDDSIVRGTTSKRIIALLKRFGAKDITLAITCPPLRYACYYGIDFPQDKELIATDRQIEEISNYVGANRLIYLEESDLEEAIDKTGLCMACVNGKYPTNIEDGKEFALMRALSKGKK